VPLYLVPYSAKLYIIYFLPPRYIVLCCADVYEEFFNPSTAAQTFLREAAAKRVVVLHISMSILSQLLGQPKLQQKSGALCMLGTLAEVLLKVRLCGLLSC